jgi:hypothetical protein
MVALIGFCLGMEEWVARFWNTKIKRDGTIRYRLQSNCFPFDARERRLFITWHQAPLIPFVTQPFDSKLLSGRMNVKYSHLLTTFTSQSFVS